MSGEKKKKRPASFNELWQRLLRKDKKKGAEEVTDKSVQRAVSKVAKVVPLKKKERKLVTSILAAEIQHLAHEKQGQHIPAGPAKEGDDVYPVPLQTGLFEQEQLDEDKKMSLEKGDSVSVSSASGHGESQSAEAYGSQPASITLDKDALLEIKKHSLISMLQEVMLDASLRQKAQAPDQKRAEDMNPDELIELRKKNVKEWEALVKENTVVSYALSKPNDREMKKAQKVKDKKKKQAKRNPLKFDDQIEVAKAPVGKDFLPNENKSKQTAVLKRK